MRFLRISSLAIIMAILPAYTAAQIIWQEAFNYPDGTQTSANWTTSFNDCDDTAPYTVNGAYWGVFNGRFRVNDIEGFDCMSGRGNNRNIFTTTTIDISNEGCVDLSVSVDNDGGLECAFPGGPNYNTSGTFSGHDQVVVEYRVDGGAWNLFSNGYFCGDEDGTANQNDVTGNTLQIRILIGNQANSENYYFDDIRITATTNSYTLPSLGPYCSDDPNVTLPNTLNGISGTWSGNGVSGNTFLPSVAGTGSQSLTFLPNAGQCAIAQSTTVDVVQAANINDIANQIACEAFVLPNIMGANVPDNAAYYTQPNAGGTRYLPGDVLTNSDLIYIYGGAGGCADQESFQITIVPTPNLSAVPAVQQSCSFYIFPSIQGSNLSNPKYYTQSNGRGQVYNSGDTLFTIGTNTIYIYDTEGSCSDQRSFSLTISQPPDLINPGNISICNQIIFPDASGTNLTDPRYVLQPNGAGTAYKPGDTLSLPIGNTTFYLYDNTNGCSDQESFIVSNNRISCTIIETTSITCFGNHDANLAVQILDGIGPFLYRWSHDTSLNATIAPNLGPGTYQVTVESETTGCTANASFTIQSPDSLVIQCDSVQNNTVPRGRNGQLFSTIIGGTSPYQIFLSGPVSDSLWVTNITSFSFSQLPEGAYQTMVVDANGCTATCTREVTSPPCDIQLNPTVILPVCANDTNGSILLNITGGTTPYQVDWSNDLFDGVSQANMLGHGNISVAVTGANGCTQDSLFSIPNVDLLTLSCTNQSDSALLQLSGGEGPYTITLTGPITDTLTYANSGSFLTPSLPTGDYNVTLQDNRGCLTQCNVFIPDPSCTLTVASTFRNESCPNTSDAQITLFISGATGHPKISWTDGNTDSIRTQLTPGNYQVQVTDDLGCRQSQQFTLSTSHSTPSFNTRISNQDICSNTCDMVTIEAQGSVPFSFSLQIASSQGTDTVNIMSSTASTQVPYCPPDGLWLDTDIQLSILNFRDNHCPAFITESLTRNIIQLDTQKITPILCPEDTFTLAGESFSRFRPEGLITLPGSAQNQCDSFLQVNLQFFQVDTNVFTPTLCWNETLQIQGQVFDRFRPTGWITFPNQTTAGCDSIVRLEAMVLPENRDTIATTICPTDTIVVAGTAYFFGASQGIETIRNAGPNGCDLTRIVDLQFTFNDTTRLDTVLCAGRSISVQGTTYDQDNSTGVEIFRNSAQNGCDSIVTISISTIQHATRIWQPTLCTQDSLEIAGQVFNQANPNGLIVLPNQAINGCDSIIDLAITYVDIADTLIENTLCVEDSLIAGTQVYTYDHPQGTEILTGASNLGCDSLLQINLQFFPSDTNRLEGVQCSSDSILVGDQLFTATNPSGLVQFTDTSPFGCASYTEVEFTFLTPAIERINDTLCYTDSLVLGNQVFTPDNPIGTVILPGIGPMQCDSIIQVDLFFRSPLSVSVTQLPSGCLGDELSLELITSSAPLELDWTSNWSGLGSNFLQLDTLMQYTFLPTPQTQLVLTTITDTATGCVQPTDLIITPRISDIQANPTQVSNYNGSAISCFGAKDGEIELRLSGGYPPYAINWNNTNMKGQRPSNLGAGKYTVQVTDTLGCSDTATIELIAPAPIQIETQIVAPTCPGEPTGLILIDNIVGGTPSYRYQLQPGVSQFLALPERIFGLEYGSYTLRIQDQNNCSQSLLIDIPNAPGQFVELPEEIEMVLGDSITLQPKFSFDPVAIFWTSQPFLDIAPVPNPVIRPQESTLIRLEAIDSTGCTVMGSLQLIVNRQLKVYAPNVFRPNSTGMNSRFMLFGGTAIERIDKLSIFDRWGQLVYENYTLAPNNWEAGWDGTYKGQSMPSGVYIYTALITRTDGRTERQSGDFILIR